SELKSGYIDVLSYSWGVSNSVKAWEKQPAGTANVHDFTLVKRVDPASPDILTACVNGKKIGSVELGLYMASGDKSPKEFAQYKLSTCYITSVRPGGSDGGDHPLEEVCFNFAKAEYKYGEKKGDFEVGKGGIQGQ